MVGPSGSSRRSADNISWRHSRKITRVRDEDWGDTSCADYYWVASPTGIIGVRSQQERGRYIYKILGQLAVAINHRRDFMRLISEYDEYNTAFSTFNIPIRWLYRWLDWLQHSRTNQRFCNHITRGMIQYKDAVLPVYGFPFTNSHSNETTSLYWISHCVTSLDCNRVSSWVNSEYL